MFSQRTIYLGCDRLEIQIQKLKASSYLIDHTVSHIQKKINLWSTLVACKKPSKLMKPSSMQVLPVLDFSFEDIKSITWFW